MLVFFLMAFLSTVVYDGILPPRSSAVLFCIVPALGVAALRPPDQKLICALFELNVRRVLPKVSFRVTGGRSCDVQNMNETVQA